MSLRIWKVSHLTRFTLRLTLLKKLDVSHFEELSGMGILAKLNDDEYYLGNHKILTRLQIKESLSNEGRRL